MAQDRRSQSTLTVAMAGIQTIWAMLSVLCWLPELPVGENIMAKISGPLLSLSATGSIAKSVVFGTWRGVKYARQHVVPANPKTIAQMLTRNTFQFGDDQYKRMLTLAQSPFIAGAIGKGFTARNIFISKYVSELRGDVDMSAYVASPGVNGGLPLLEFTAVDAVAAGTIDVSATIPPLPVGWTHDAVIYTLFKDRAPDAQMTDFMTEAESLAAAWAAGPPKVSTLALSGLTPTVKYAVSAFLRSTRADGVIAYGVSQTVLVTVT